MIELRQISKIYASKGGQVPALVDVDLVLPASGLIFVLGKSGCGKDLQAASRICAVPF